MKAEIVNGNYSALVDARNANISDLQPNITTMRNAERSEDAFVTVANSDGQKYKICASDSGWIWSYTTQIQHTDNGTKTQCVVQTGTYSKNGKILGISYQTLSNIPTDLTAIATAMIMSSITFNFVKQYIMEGIFELALNRALSAAAADAVAGGFMISEAAASIVAFVGAGLAAGVIGAVIAIIVFFVADVLHRSYGLIISVYNWDVQSAWKVTSWYGDNAVVSQETKADGPWRQANLLPVQSKICSSVPNVLMMG